MSTNQPVIVTSVNTLGVAIADFDLVNFTVTVRETGETKAIAKTALSETVSKIDEVLAELESSGVSIDHDRLTRKNSISTDYKQVEKNWVPSGYVTTHTLCFQSSSVDEASVIFDKFSSIEKVVVGSPDFKIRDLTALHAAGREDAFAKAMALFHAECKTVGRDPASLKMLSHSFNYSDRHSGGGRPAVARSYMMAAHTESIRAAPEPIAIEAGKAEVCVNVRLDFVENPNYVVNFCGTKVP
jgi:uncharacterized protein YggE